MAHRLSEEAESELDAIWYYVAKECGSTHIAKNLIESITARFFMLAEHPHMGRSRNHDLSAGLRTFPVGEYIIVYCVEESVVLILHVMRGSRDIAKLLGG